MSKFKNWMDIEKDFHFTEEEDSIMELELDVIKATIEARKKNNLTQRELSKKSGIKQPSIAKIENLKHSPQAITLIKLLYPMGYTIKVIPLKERKLKSSKKNRVIIANFAIMTWSFFV